MSLEHDLGRLAAAVADAAAVGAQEVVLLLGDEDAGPLAVALAGTLGARGAVVRPWLRLGGRSELALPAVEALTSGLADRADVVLGLGVTPPAGAGRRLQVAVPSHASAQEAGCSLPAHARALADAPGTAIRVVRPEAAAGG